MKAKTRKLRKARGRQKAKDLKWQARNQAGTLKRGISIPDNQNRRYVLFDDKSGKYIKKDITFPYKLTTKRGASTFTVENLLWDFKHIVESFKFYNKAEVAIRPIRIS